MNKILALWAIPRSRSTVFQCMMKQRGDYWIEHEPFAKSAYFSEERIFNWLAHLPAEPEYNYNTVLQRLLSTAEGSRVFIKDMAKNIVHIADDTFLSYFQHTFLIRDPAQMLPSFFHALPELIKYTGYRELFELFEKVVDSTGQIPPLIDADDLVKYPEIIVQTYCKTVGISFVAKAMKWDLVDDKNISNWENDYWHDYLRSTTGFQDQMTSSYLDVNEHDGLKRAYEDCLPFYEKLYKHRLVAVD